MEFERRGMFVRNNGGFDIDDDWIDRKVTELLIHRDTANTINYIGGLNPYYTHQDFDKKVSEDMKKSINSFDKSKFWAGNMRRLWDPEPLEIRDYNVANSLFGSLDNDDEWKCVYLFIEDDIEDVYFNNNGVTTVKWADGSVTTVKCQADKGDKFDPEVGIAMCICKKAFGNDGSFNEVLKKYVKKYDDMVGRKNKKSGKKSNEDGKK